jgi:hypothetical protein
VVVLAVIFPATLSADFISAALIKRSMAAARTRVPLAGFRREYVRLAVIEVKPRSASGEQLVVS